MTSYRFRAVTVVLLLIAANFYSCSFNSRKRSEVIWEKSIPVIGSQSSPRTADLNGDGTLDIIIGAGKNEYQPSDMGILTFNGKTGELLWKQQSTDQMYGTAALYDVTDDNIKDVFIGGRSPQLKALDGKNGNLLWEYNFAQYGKDSILKYARFNFNNSIIVPDQNKDGKDDLLTINGGNSYAQPYSRVGRYPGVLMLLDSKTGKVIAADTMPDGRESYTPPLCFTAPGGKEMFIVFGTGGETIEGNLYITTMSQFVSGQLAKAKVIASDTGHGFIAPATLADITADGHLDIIAISHGSKAVAIDGRDYRQIWSNNFTGTECSNSFAAGYFTNDEVPDFFTFISKGQWPNSTGSVQVMINGKSGQVEYRDSIGCTGFSSPVVYDLNGDGRDEALISINDFDCSLGYASKSPRLMQNKLISVDFTRRQTAVIEEAQGFKNIFSTPWIGDLDNDGYLDIIHCQYFHHSDLLSFLGMRVKRIDTPVKISKKVRWGSYLGAEGNGIFKN